MVNRLRSHWLLIWTNANILTRYIQSIYDKDIIVAVPNLPPLFQYDDPPNWKSGGLSGIVPELILFDGPVLQDRLLS